MPVCYRHPDRQTLLGCSRCGRPICSDCSIDAPVGQRCPECIRAEGTQKVIPTGSRRSALASARAPATLTFIGLAVGFYFLGALGLDEQLIRRFAQINRAVAAGEWWRIYTVVLLHGSITHILFNMWALWVLGPQVERGVGTRPFIGLYLASAAVGGAFAFHLGNPGDIGVGASGAIFGLFGIWLSWAMNRRNTMHGRALLGQLGFLLLINATIPFIFRNISWQAHLGGIIAGFLLGEIWSRIKGPDADRLRTAAALAVGVLATISVMV
jgi:membrane associated rhomboid family serine protease